MGSDCLVIITPTQLFLENAGCSTEEILICISIYLDSIWLLTKFSSSPNDIYVEALFRLSLKNWSE